MKTIVIPLLALFTSPLRAQEVPFLQHSAFGDRDGRDEGTTVKEHRMVSDTMFVEDLDSGDLRVVVGEPVLVLLEMERASGRTVRRYDVRQEPRLDSVYTENVDTGEFVLVVNEVVIDIPDGLFEEYHPNGRIKVQGGLGGFDEDGTPKKIGLWTEWDADGRMIRSHNYP